VTTVDAVRRYLDALNAGDADAAAAAVTDDFLNEHTSARGTNVCGRADYRARLGEFLAQFRGLHYAPEEVIVEGERAAVPYRMTCLWVDDSGREHPVSMRGMFRFRVRDDLVAHRVDYWDGEEFRRQVTGSRDGRA
jgi:ketosteroid isomerase-like protein